MFDSRTIENKIQLQETLAACAERLPAIIADEAGKRINEECRSAEKGAIETLTKKLEGLSNWCGIVCDTPGETHDQRQAARNIRASQAKNFLTAYDCISRNKPVENSDFDPRLMRFIVAAVKAVKAYESSRADIVMHLQNPAPAMAATAAPVQFEEIVIDSRSMK